jgi:hypothetical protein
MMPFLEKKNILNRYTCPAACSSFFRYNWGKSKQKLN